MHATARHAVIHRSYYIKMQKSIWFVLFIQKFAAIKTGLCVKTVVNY